MTRLVSTLCTAILLASCSQSGPAPAGGLITDRGSFPSPLSNHILVIGSKTETLVDYRIVNAATEAEFAPKKLFSDTMRWAACWEDDDTLWVYSSDNGLSVWKRSSNSTFAQQWLIQRADLIPTIPPNLWNFLPNSLKRQWKSVR